MREIEEEENIMKLKRIKKERQGRVEMGCKRKGKD